MKQLQELINKWLKKHKKKIENWELIERECNGCWYISYYKPWIFECYWCLKLN